MSTMASREAVRRFLAGESVAELAWHMRVPRAAVEAALRAFTCARSCTRRRRA